MSIFQREVLNPVRDAIDGKVVQIPISLDRISNYLSIRQSIYTLIGGNTGSGKTSFVDDTYVLKPYMLWDKYKDNTDVTFRVLYRSMERKRSLKLAKWACWKMYQDSGILMDSDTLLGYKKVKASEEIWKRLVDSRDWADKLLDYVDIRDGRTTPSEYSNWVQSHALKHGKLLVADSVGLFWAGSKQISYIDLFKPDKTISLDSGDRVEIVSTTYRNVEYVLKSGERKYIPNRDKEITIVIGDHVGKASPDAGQRSKKEVIDKFSEHNSDFRDIYSYSPVAISQFNRAVGDIQRIKHSKGDLAPIIEDFKESGNTQEDADLILAIFNPYRYKAYDEDGIYKGYNIRDRMVSPLGFNRYRLLSVLKNSYGVDDVEFGLKFMGEVNDFRTLPKPTNEHGAINPELSIIYNNIRKGY